MDRGIGYYSVLIFGLIMTYLLGWMGILGVADLTDRQFDMAIAFGSVSFFMMAGVGAFARQESFNLAALLWTGTALVIGMAILIGWWFEDLKGGGASFSSGMINLPVGLMAGLLADAASRYSEGE